MACRSIKTYYYQFDLTNPAAGEKKIMFNLFKHFFNKKPKEKNNLETLSILLTKLLKLYILSFKDVNLSLVKHQEFIHDNSKIKINISFIKINKYNILPYASIDHISNNELIESVYFMNHSEELIQSYKSNFNLKVKYFNDVNPSLIKKTINYIDSLYIQYI